MGKCAFFLVAAALCAQLACAKGFLENGDAAELETLRANQKDIPARYCMKADLAMQGRVETLTFSTKSGQRHRLRVYTPPSFDASKKYPVLFLLHGAHGDESTWVENMAAANILDNMIAGGEIEPLVAVMPSMSAVDEEDVPASDRKRGAKPDAAPTRPPRNGQERAMRSVHKPDPVFLDIFLNELAPFVEERYPTFADRRHRAVAGVSLGAGWALKIAMAAPDRFACVGAFSGGTQRIEDVEALKSATPSFACFYLSVGDKDTLIARRTAAFESALTQANISHVFRVNDGGHERKVWKNDLYYFAREIFKEKCDCLNKE